MDEAIVRHVRKHLQLDDGEPTAEEIKIKIGSAYPLQQELKMDVRGRDLVAGLPKTVEVTSEEIRESAGRASPADRGEALCGSRRDAARTWKRRYRAGNHTHRRRLAASKAWTKC